MLVEIYRAASHWGRLRPRAPPARPKLAAIERLNELRSAGTLGEENYRREKRRILGLG